MGLRTHSLLRRGASAVVRQKGMKRRIAVLAALLAPMFVALGIAPVSANSGTVSATQNCQTWNASVSLNHDVQPDRSVDVITTIPGTTGFTGHHYNTSYGEIWSASGAAPTTGSVTLNIYFANGQLEFTDSKTLPAPEGCTATTTAVASTSTTTTTSTTVASTTTIAPTSTTTTTVAPPTTTSTIGTQGSTVSTTPATTTSSTAPSGTTIGTEGNTATTSGAVAPATETTAGTATAAAANTLPRTGGGGGGPMLGLVSLLAGGVLLVLSRRRRLY